MFKSKVQELLQNALNQREDLFLIDLRIGVDNSIKVIIDGDKGVLVEDCIAVSRAIEHNLDREEQDFSLEVASAGATTPLSNKRQYNKHIGRILSIKTNTQTIEGVLDAVNIEEHVTLKWKTREPKPIGKGKVTVTKQANIKFEDIIEAKVKIKF